MKQSLVTLDMEGVLTPEIWIAVAKETGVEALMRTTRDEPDYDVLMRYRLGILEREGITLSQIQKVIGSLGPMEGALEFLDELRSLTQVVILSDTFEQFAAPFMRDLRQPTLLCHRLIVENDRITDYQMRITDPKRKAVAAFKSLNYRVIAAGDSYNDTTMLIEADTGFLIHSPENVKREFPQFKPAESLPELLEFIKGELA
jgi:phosphoserine/homoserine phosphotransferase